MLIYFWIYLNLDKFENDVTTAVLTYAYLTKLSENFLNIKIWSSETTTYYNISISNKRSQFTF